jgi:hypothetical protein
VRVGPWAVRRVVQRGVGIEGRLVRLGCHCGVVGMKALVRRVRARRAGREARKARAALRSVRWAEGVGQMPRWVKWRASSSDDSEGRAEVKAWKKGAGLAVKRERRLRRRQFMLCSRRVQCGSSRTYEVAWM